MLRLVLRRAVVMTVTGLIVGLAGALAISRVMTSLLFDVAPRDPATHLAATALLAAVALIAA